METLLLAFGVLGPALFVVGFLFLGWKRRGYMPRYTFASQLALDGGGWQWQVVNVVAGLFIVLAGLGLREAATGELASWGGSAVLLGGIGFVIFGVSRDDPWLLYPPVAPPGISTPVTAHGWGHQLGALIAFIGLESAQVLFAYGFANDGDVWPAVYSAATAIVFPALYVAALVSAVASWVPGHPWSGRAGLLQKASIATSLAWVAFLAWQSLFLPVGP